VTTTQLLLALGVLLLGTALSPALPDPEADVRDLLERQQQAWNRRDLEGFMAGYWKSDDLTFFSSGNVTRGWQATLDRYRQHYQSPGTEMGRLEFRHLRIEKLGAEAAFARGEYHLAMASGKTPHGIFTLILRRFPEGWRIVHDHTSAAE
jgi:beta-aspartyl-peptidase (threonine type)